MKIKIIFLASLLLVTSKTLAVDEQQNQNLQYQLQQRDQVILELIERLETLETELGIKYEPEFKRSTNDTRPEKKVDPENNKQAPGSVVVDESMAERALERALTSNGMLLLPSRVFEFESRLTYARQENATSSFINSGGSIIASETEQNSDLLTASLLLRIGLPGNTQLQVGIPYRWRRIETVTNVGFSPLETATQSGQGPGDLLLSFSSTLSTDASGFPSIIGNLSWDTDTGETSDEGVGLGGGFHEVQAGLSFISRQDPVVFTGALGYEYTFEETGIQPGGIIAGSFGSYIALNPQTSLNMSLALAYQDETKISGIALDGSSRKIATLVLGGSTLLGRGTVLNVSVGIGLTDDADDLGLTIALPIRF